MWKTISLTSDKHKIKNVLLWTTERKGFFKSVKAWKTNKGGQAVAAGGLSHLLSTESLLQGMQFAHSLQLLHLLIYCTVYTETTLPIGCSQLHSPCRLLPTRGWAWEDNYRWTIPAQCRPPLMGNFCSGAPNGPCDGSYILCLLYLDYGGGHNNLYMWQCCTKLNTHI